MSTPLILRVGDPVQTPFGNGVVREVRNHGRVLVDVRGRGMDFPAADVSPVPVSHRTARSRPAARRRALSREVAPHLTPDRRIELDLHGLTVPEALARVESAINDALLADLPELRLIHGRSGGRIRAALQTRLRELPVVRAVRLDPTNDGVTIVSL
jgi:DNA mismatch repair protein MutS2